DRLRCTVDVDPAAHGAAIPVFLLQPLVENAVRHGSASEYEPTHIRVAIARSGDRLHVTVDNSITAVPAEPSRIGTGLGTTRDRLRLLYGPAAALETSTNDGRFRASIELPARQAPPAEPVPDPEHAGAHR